MIPVGCIHSSNASTPVFIGLFHARFHNTVRHNRLLRIVRHAEQTLAGISANASHYHYRHLCDYSERNAILLPQPPRGCLFVPRSIRLPQDLEMQVKNLAVSNRVLFLLNRQPSPRLIYNARRNIEPVQDIKEAHRFLKKHNRQEGLVIQIDARKVEARVMSKS